MERGVLEKAVAATSAIYIASDKQSLFQALDDSCHLLGFDLFLLACHKATRQEVVMNSTFTTIPRSFLTDYERLDWFDDDFNMIRALDSGDEPFFWDSARDSHAVPRKQSFIDYLRSKSMMNGLLVPLSGRTGTASVLSLITLQPGTFGRGVAEAANVIGNAALAKAEILGLCDAVSADEAAQARLLSDIQSEVLTWIAEGKSNTDIGTIMDMSERTVRYHVSVILQKLGVASRAQAAAIHTEKKIDPGG